VKEIGRRAGVGVVVMVEDKTRNDYGSEGMRLKIYTSWMDGWNICLVCIDKGWAV